MKVELLAITPDAESLIEKAGRVCYASEPKGDSGGFIRRRIKEGHESILEHAGATFLISGISRACSHQLVRHRIASYSQESQRYVDGSDFQYIIPETIRKNSTALKVFLDCIKYIKESYTLLRNLDIPKEDARFLLPNAAGTKIVMTMNFREFRHFIRLRGIEKGAQWEIRQLALEILNQLYRQCPSVFQDLVDEASRSGNQKS